MISLPAFAGTVGGGTTGGSDEQWNHFVDEPTDFANASAFVVVYKGDQTGNIPTQVVQGLTDAFANPNAITVLFDGVNTNVTFSGDPLPASLADGALEYNNTVHFGLDNGANTQNLMLLDSYWVDSEDSNITQDEPVVNVSFGNRIAPATGSDSNAGTDPYAEIFISYETSDGTTGGDWYEIPYTGPLPPLNISNPTGGPITIDNAGFFISESYIPLDQLNFTTEPPPGMPGSPYTPLPNLDGRSLDGGRSFDIVVPLPASAVSGAVLLTGIFGMRRRSSCETVN
ncbi:MAG TPA: hypothetical protein VG722_07205 [Tepidisphaeraceae bacterium]|nr:hypothetical protein [Tepidisphaeraceae bacterium]